MQREARSLYSYVMLYDKARKKQIKRKQNINITSVAYLVQQMQKICMNRRCVHELQNSSGQLL